MQKTLLVADGFPTAHVAEREQDQQPSMQDRFCAFMTIMEPYYVVSEGLQRVYRIDDFKRRAFRDDWGVRLQPVQQVSAAGICTRSEIERTSGL